MAKLVNLAKSMRKLAQDDSRRVIHSVKVGLAMTLISLFYYTQPLYQGLGNSALWAVLTVIVVFEFYVGASLGKGLNRAMATLVAGALGVGVHSLASQCGYIGQPLLVGALVFLQATAATFMRFFPRIKARYDYGFLIFILTFAFISISGVRADEILELARKRGATIVIGVLDSLLVSVLLFPAWAGEDLHNMVANNIDNLGDSLKGFGIAYFEMQEHNAQNCDISMLQTYKSVLNSKNTEETLANFARWEPCHGRFRFRHPWKQYIKLGALTRECAYKIDSLSCQLNLDKKAATKIRREIREECNRMSSEASKALKEIARALKEMTQPSSCKAHVAKSKASVKSLKELLNSSTLWEDCEVLHIIPAATIASILIDIVSCTEKIAECANSLSSLAHFKTTKLGSTQLQSNNIDRELKKLDSIKSSGNQDQSRLSNNNVNLVSCSHIVIAIEAGD